MQAQRWDRVAELFLELTTLPAEQRDTFIRQACGEDTDLQDELSSLLRSHESESGPLDAAPILSLAEDTSVDASPEAGTHVGPYRLIRSIGEGGMGSVWLAERVDGTLKRTVALKQPHVSWAGTLAERMARERDILASLEHPNIARLYDAGVTKDRHPYLALEYIEGVPITAYCDSKCLSIRRRLDLFLQVLEAIRYAHAHLVIHRDIKPSNILVSSAGRVHLLDFGIAKLLHENSVEDGHTQWGAAATPDYASPEQIAGRQVSTRSDIYSLGVLLCELLAGSRPYALERTSRGALEQAILQAEPLAPSRCLTPEAAAARGSAAKTLARELRGDLDNIVLKSLRKDPAERYSSVDQLSLDIERHLRGEPVHAHPSSLGYRAKKFLDRYRFAVAGSSAVATALAVGTAAALWQAHLANLAAARAEQVKNFTLSILEGADTNSGAGTATTAVELLQAARERVAGEYGGRPEIAAELKTTIAFGLIGHDRSDEAAVLLEEAIELWMQTYGPLDARTIGAQVMYGEALYNLGRNDEALAVLTPAAQHAREASAHHAQIDAWRWLSSAQINAGNMDDAVASARAAVAAIPRTSSADRQSLRDAMHAHLALANALSSARASGVVEEVRAALALAAQMNPPPQTVEARVLLGMGLVREGQVADGLKEMQAAYAESRARLGDQHQQTEIIASLVGHACMEAGDAEGAVAAYQASFDSLVQRPIERGSFALAMGHYGLAVALVATRERERAEPLLREAARLFAQAQGEEGSMTLRARSTHALTLSLLGRHEEAEQAFASLAPLSFAAPELAAHNGRLATHRSLQGRHEEAIILAKSSAEALQSHPSKTIRAQNLASLGSVLLDAARIDEAIAAFERSIELYSEAQPQVSRDRADAMADLDRARAMLAGR